MHTFTFYRVQARTNTPRICNGACDNMRCGWSKRRRRWGRRVGFSARACMLYRPLVLCAWRIMETVCMSTGRSRPGDVQQRFWWILMHFPRHRWSRGGEETRQNDIRATANCIYICGVSNLCACVLHSFSWLWHGRAMYSRAVSVPCIRNKCMRQDNHISAAAIYHLSISFSRVFLAGAEHCFHICHNASLLLHFVRCA